MVAPVTGPFVTEIGGTGIVTTYIQKRGYKQAKPIDQVLPYEAVFSFAKHLIGGAFHARTITGGIMTLSTLGSASTWAHLNSGAYGKLVDKISDRASLGVTFAEFGQSLSMIQNRALQVARFAKRLKKLDFQGAANELRMASVPKGVGVHKSFANNFLEYWFGWSPLIGDIHSAIDVLQSPINDQYVTAQMSNPIMTYQLSVPQEGSNPNAIYPNWMYWKSYRVAEGKLSVRVGATVGIDNPNLWLANQLGLVNPAVIAYELIPFSFIANWFVNVEQFLSSGTDFLGLTLKDTWTTRRFSGTYDSIDIRKWRQYTNGAWVTGGGVFNACSGNIVAVQRVKGLPQPVLHVRPWKPWKWQRTASAVSLVVQRLK